MSASSELDIHSLDVDLIDVMISRARNMEEWEQVKASMADIGLKTPIQVRDISHLPAKDRVRPDGGHYRYQLVYGQGRVMAAKALGWKKIDATITDAPEIEVSGRFLAENLIREDLPWYEKAKLVKSEIDGGASVDDVGKRFKITPGHVRRFIRVVSKTAASDEEMATLSLEDAAGLTALPAEDQKIVWGVMRETGTREIKAVISRARKLTEGGGELSAAALKQSIRRVGEDLQELREEMKPKRRHHALGPMALLPLLQKKKFRAALIAHGVNVELFEDSMK